VYESKIRGLVGVPRQWPAHEHEPAEEEEDNNPVNLISRELLPTYILKIPVGSTHVPEAESQ
jgi:hypothetical protein